MRGPLVGRDGWTAALLLTGVLLVAAVTGRKHALGAIGLVLLCTVAAVGYRETLYIV